MVQQQFGLGPAAARDVKVRQAVHIVQSGLTENRVSKKINQAECKRRQGCPVSFWDQGIVAYLTKLSKCTVGNNRLRPDGFYYICPYLQEYSRMELKDKVAVVTGVSKGIGLRLVEQLLAKGARVAGWGRQQPQIQHPDFRFFECNVRDMESVNTAFRDTQEAFGESIHILVNNAGLGYFGYLEEMSPERFFELYEVNVYGIFYTCRNIIPVMKKQQHGHIINISSIAGLEGMQQVAAYCGAKHAVRGITDSLYKELRDFGIKVTGVYPGSTNTDFFAHAEGIKAHDRMMDPAEVAAQIVWALETSDNFLMNSMEFRPLQPKPKK